jgi:hypothetical protein
MPTAACGHGNRMATAICQITRKPRRSAVLDVAPAGFESAREGSRRVIGG